MNTKAHLANSPSPFLSASNHTSSLTRLHGLDALRGIAATAVVLHHVIWLLNITLTPFLTPVGYYFGLGVPLFFMISSFTMFHVYEGKMHLRNAEKIFLVKRYFRLLPLIFIVYLTYNTALYWLYGSGFTGLSVTTVLAYVSLLFALVPNISVGPTPASWSIGVEMLFYLMLPLALSLFKSMRLTFVAVLLSYALSFSFQFQIDPLKMPNIYYQAINPILFLPCFMLGIVVFRLKDTLLSTTLKPWAGNIAILIALVALVLLVMQPGVWTTPNAGVSYWLKVQLFSLFFAVLVFVAAYAPSILLTNYVASYFGKLSYAIYLIHAPIIALAVKPLVPNLTQLSGGDPNLLFLLCSFVTLAITLPLAHLAYELIEKPGIALGAKVARRLEKRDEPSNVKSTVKASSITGST